LRRALAEAVLACDPAGADQRVQDVRRDRRVVFTPVADGMSELWALLPAVAAARARAGLECAAREAAAPGDDRTADQRRADTLVDLLAGGGAGPGDADAGSRGGSRARCGPPMQVVVTLPLETLLAKSDSPGYLDGYGPIPARMARDAAAEGTWRCAVVDGVHVTLLGLGRATYTPGYRAGVSAERHVEVRDRTCTFPGCHQPARRCDADHRVKHPGGATCECNLQSLCRHHHRLKHRGGFRVGTTADPNLPPGTLSWATPAGFRHFRPPTRLGRPMAKAPPSDTGDPPPF